MFNIELLVLRPVFTLCCIYSCIEDLTCISGRVQGQGLLITEDNCSYEGEFSGGPNLSGKVRTIPAVFLEDFWQNVLLRVLLYVGSDSVKFPLSGILWLHWWI